jgi:cytochrome P450
MHTFSRYAEVRAALTDEALVPVPASAGAPVGTMAWLRSQVARFSSGPDHTRRRAMVTADLASVTPSALATLSAPPNHPAAVPGGPSPTNPAAVGTSDQQRQSSAGAVGGSGRQPWAPTDAVGGSDERRLVVAALAGALGSADPEAVADAVAVASTTYFGGADRAADQAVGWLLAHVLKVDPAADVERAANRIGLLIQAGDATATLIANARAALPAAPDVETALAETLRDNPPVRVMRRVAIRATRVGDVPIAAGEEIALDVAAAAKESGVTLTFGVAPRTCPGREHALALAAGRLAGHPFDTANVP